MGEIEEDYVMRWNMRPRKHQECDICHEPMSIYPGSSTTFWSVKDLDDGQWGYSGHTECFKKNEQPWWKEEDADKVDDDDLGTTVGRFGGEEIRVWGSPSPASKVQNELRISGWSAPCCGGGGKRIPRYAIDVKYEVRGLIVEVVDCGSPDGGRDLGATNEAFMIAHYEGCQRMRDKETNHRGEIIEKDSIDWSRFRKFFILAIGLACAIAALMTGNPIFLMVSLGILISNVSMDAAPLAKERIEAFKESRVKPELPSSKQIHDERRKEIRAYRYKEMSRWEDAFKEEA